MSIFVKNNLFIFQHFWTEGQLLVVTNRGRFKSKRVLFDFDPKILLFENEKAFYILFNPSSFKKRLFQILFSEILSRILLPKFDCPNPDTASFGLKFWPQGPIWSH